MSNYYEKNVEISPQFRQRIQELILDNDCNNIQFAGKVSVSKDVIVRATKYGIVPSLKVLIKIADALNISIEYLLAETDNVDFCKSDSQVTFLERLEFLKNRKGVKYSEIAHTMPFPPNLFYDWQRRNLLPTLENLSVLADYFNVSKDFLLGRTDDEHN